MNKKKSFILVSTIINIMSTSGTVSADIITMDFNGLFTLTNGSGNTVFLNQDATDNQDFGFRTNMNGTGLYDTDSGSGSFNLNPYSFFGGGLMSFDNFSIQSIGDGLGGNGTLIASQMSINWNGNTIPATAIFDAAGFFNSIGAVGTTWTVDAGCADCATSTTPDWFLVAPFSGSVGAVPIVMTNYNTAGTTLSSLFPLTDDGISGNPIRVAPVPGDNPNFDFTSITATNNGVGTVPVPAAIWLFGSGLVGLAGVARRRRS